VGCPDRGRRRQILSGQDPIHIFGEGNEIRSFIALGDLVRGIAWRSSRRTR